MPAFTNRLAIAHHNGADERVWLDVAAAKLGQRQRALHPVLVVVHGVLSLAKRRPMPDTGRGVSWVAVVMKGTPFVLPSVAVVGATGAVGEIMRQVLDERSFPLRSSNSSRRNAVPAKRLCSRVNRITSSRFAPKHSAMLTSYYPVRLLA